LVSIILRVMSHVDCPESGVIKRAVELALEALHHNDDDALEFHKVNIEAHTDTLLDKAYVLMHPVPLNEDVAFHLVHLTMEEVPKQPDVLEAVVDFPFAALLPNYLDPSDEVEGVMKLKVAEDLWAVCW
jgi:hypothetical protein